MMKGKLAAYKIKVARRERQHRAIRAQPSDIWRLKASLSQHAPRAIETDIPATPQRNAVRHQLISGAAADVQNGQVSSSALSGEQQKLRIRRAGPVRLRVVKIGDLVVVYSCIAPHRGLSYRQECRASRARVSAPPACAPSLGRPARVCFDEALRQTARLPHRRFVEPCRQVMPAIFTCFNRLRSGIDNSLNGGPARTHER